MHGKLLFATLLVIAITLTACTLKKPDITREQARSEEHTSELQSH